MSNQPGLSSKNSIIIKQHPQVGQQKKSIIDLPNHNYTYGKKSNQPREGAKEITMTWQNHEPTTLSIVQKDFKGLNRQSLKDGVCNPKVTNKLQKKGLIRMEERQGWLNQDSKGIKQRQIQQPLYGFFIRKKMQTLDPHERYHRQLNNKQYQEFAYANENEKLLNELYARKKQLKVEKPQTQQVNKYEKTFGIATQPNTQRNQEFKMQRFKNVESKVLK